MSRKHTAALKAKFQEITALASKTFVTRAPNGTPPPYAVIHPAKGVNSQDRLTGPYTTKHPRFTAHIVGETADQVELIGDLLEEKLLPGGFGIQINVAGETGRNLWFESPLPVQVSTDPLPEVIYLVVEVGWTSDPISS